MTHWRYLGLFCHMVMHHAVGWQIVGGGGVLMFVHSNIIDKCPVIFLSIWGGAGGTTGAF